MKYNNIIFLGLCLGILLYPQIALLKLAGASSIMAAQSHRIRLILP